LVRSDRRFLVVSGKAPGEMLNGLLTNTPPPPLATLLEEGGEEAQAGAAVARFRGSPVYSALLTPKGRMITDLRVFSNARGGFLLDLPSVAFDGALIHFRKFLPPRLAGVEDRSSQVAILTLSGPEAPGLLAHLLAERFSGPAFGEMGSLREGQELVLAGPDPEEIRIVGNGDFPTEAWDLVLPAELADGLIAGLKKRGAEILSEDALELLRIEKGRPVFGKDMDENTIPMEAGIQARAIDNRKGCYTGQEVIIRIRDRGQVNKHLRGLLLGDAALPASGQELFHPEKEKSVGWITSAAVSPHFGQTVALGYLHRSVVPGESVRLGDPGGPVARVRALSDDGWAMD